MNLFAFLALTSLAALLVATYIPGIDRCRVVAQVIAFFMTTFASLALLATSFVSAPAALVLGAGGAALVTGTLVAAIRVLEDEPRPVSK